MYAMSIVASFVFKIMMFLHDGKIVTVEKITYYEKNISTTPDGVLPFVGYSLDLMTTFTKFKPTQFKPSTLLGTYPGDPLPLH